MTKSKPKVLFYGDFATWTGFATVNENIVSRLKDDYDITVLATNYFGEPHDWGIKVMPAIKFATDDPRYTDINGQQRLIDELAQSALKDEGYDILFFHKDAVNTSMNNFGKNIKELQKLLQKNGKKVFKWVFYAAIDSPPREHWIDDALGLADYPVTYTKWAKKEVKKIAPSLNIRTIYLGIDFENFKPLNRAERKRIRKEVGIEKDFIVTNVNRNMPRKDIPSTLLAFKLFKKKVPNAKLYLHMRHQDLGGDFRLMAQELGLEFPKDIIFPEMNEYNMPTKEQINDIYNFSDMIISTTYGEGWGFSSTEAMAAKTAVVFPNHTSLMEIIGDDRGYLADIGKDYNAWVNRGTEYFNIWCQRVDVYDMADKMWQCYQNKKETEKRVENAYEWVQKLNWDNLAKEWDLLFKEALEK